MTKPASSKLSTDWPRELNKLGENDLARLFGEILERVQSTGKSESAPASLQYCTRAMDVIGILGNVRGSTQWKIPDKKRKDLITEYLGIYSIDNEGYGVPASPKAVSTLFYGVLKAVGIKEVPQSAERGFDEILVQEGAEQARAIAYEIQNGKRPDYTPRASNTVFKG